MSIGIMIQNYRKKCGFTQEQVAAAVGVSKPAVSKWESCNTYPDITLLAPLARLFGTTVDSLLEYNMSLTDEEIEEITAQFANILSAFGWEKANGYAENQLHQFPNVNELKVAVAQAYFNFALLASDTIFQNEAIPKSFELLQQVVKRADCNVKEIALTHLAHNSLLMKDYGQALSAAEQLPQEKVETEILLATIHFHSGNYSSCKLLSQKILFRSYKNCDLSLELLEKVAWMENENTEQLNLLQKHTSFYRIFEVDSKISLLLEMAEVYAKMKAPEKAIDTLKEFSQELKTAKQMENSKLFYLLDFEFEESPELAKAAFHKLAEHLSSDTFKDLKNNKDFQKIIDMVKNKSI